MTIVSLQHAASPDTFGGKAHQLGAAIGKGLPVPPGYALSVDALAALVNGDANAAAQIAQIVHELGGPFAARSSAVGEDSAGASFAGQHATVLNLATPESLIEGLCKVHASAHDPGALAYRQKKGLAGAPRIAAVVQVLVDPRCAGVMFTRNPMTGADEFIIEAAWGLGEAVVQGIVTPDHIRLGRDGAVVEQLPGDKAIAIRCSPSGGTEEVDVAPADVEALCIGHGDIAALHALALQAEAAFGPDLDIEWALRGDDLFLLQSRPITTLP